jgi:hypothetical protein
MDVGGGDFWAGAGFTGLTGLIGTLIVRWFTRRESLEDRLQRWQEDTVKRVHGENALLRKEVADLEKEVDILKRRDARTYIIETCLRLVVVELKHLAPHNEKLNQVATMLARTVPFHPDLPDDMLDLLRHINDGHEPS